MKINGKTDVGKVRDNNQDSFAIVEFSSEAAAIIICDGMGGANGGSVASETAVSVISEKLTASYRDGMNSKSIKSAIESAILAANITVFDMAQSKNELKGMGTTVIVMVIANRVAHIAHVGDSRVYSFKNNSELKQITRDHSIVQQMVESGKLTVEEARFHPKRNVITRALGVSEAINIDYNEIDLNDQDKYIACTDGLTNYLTNEEIIDTIINSGPDKCSEKLVEAANKNGGGDNITVVVVCV